MIKLSQVTKAFGTGILGLEEISLEIENGEFVFLVGKTGSGKTTLLRLLIRETLPTKGTITIADIDITKLPKKKVPHLRKKIGIVFQDLKLLADRTIFENVMLPLEIANIAAKEATAKVEEALASVDILSHKDKFPVQLSGGELQRVAIARALILGPEILLADEPTGNLDDKTAFDIVNLLSEINKKGTTVVMATHNVNILNAFKKRIVKLEKGKIVEDNKKKTVHEHKKEDVEIEKIIKTEDKEDKEEKEEKKEKEKEKHGKTH